MPAYKDASVGPRTLESAVANRSSVTVLVTQWPCCRPFQLARLFMAAMVPVTRKNLSREPSACFTGQSQSPRQSQVW